MKFVSEYWARLVFKFGYKRKQFLRKPHTTIIFTLNFAIDLSFLWSRIQHLSSDRELDQHIQSLALPLVT